MRLCVFPVLALAMSATSVGSGRSEPQIEGVTLHSIGCYWIVSAEPPNRTVRVEWRPGGETAWRIGPPLVRVAPRAHLSADGHSELKVGGNEALFAGSIVSLQPDTEYELRFADSEEAESKMRRTRTGAEP